jgi:hypothetical protein
MKIAVTIMILFAAAPFLLGHGVTVTAEQRYPCVVVNARYHGSKALVNASVTIRFEKEKKEFQQGNTDKNGNFCFLPDKAGEWIVTVDDLIGHRGKKTVTITGGFFKTSSSRDKEKKEVTPVKEETNFREKEEISKKSTQMETGETRESASSSGEWCCYLLKIILGVLLILVITYIFYRFRKPKESSREK